MFTIQTGYLDNAATTQLSQASKQAMIQAFDCFGNPSSLHSLGTKSAVLLEESRGTVADALAVAKDEVYFTSGGTESDNIAIFGAANALKRRGNRIVTTSVEHPAVLNSMIQLQKQGFEVIFLNPDKTGAVPIEKFERAINTDTILVSVMHMNNETGAVMPINQIKSLIKKVDSPALFHCDYTQGFLKYTLDARKNGIDLMTVSSHKIHGPKGIGALYIRKGVRILPQNYGGGQEKGIRSGTQPMILITGFAAAVKDIGDISVNAANAKSVKDYIINKLSSNSDVVINSPRTSSDFILNLSVMGIKSETMLHFLEQRGVYISSGSACAKGKASHVLKAMGFDNRRIDSAIRISLSRFTTTDDADMLVEGIEKARDTIIRFK